MPLRATALLAVTMGAAAAPPKPHVLFILADDYGWNDIGYHQNQASSANPQGKQTTNGVIPTPTLDSLAAEAVKLENYYTEFLCSPTRGTIMTGRYASHTGIGPDVIRSDMPYGMPKKEVFWPELMKANGYKTHMVGKWHLGICHERYTPTFRGFDSHTGYLLGAEDYFTHTRAFSPEDAVTDDLPAKPGGKMYVDFRNGSVPNEMPGVPTGINGTYSDTIFADEATRIIRAHDPDTPFYMYLPFQSVHGPNMAPEKYIKKMQGVIPHATEDGMFRLTKAAMVSAMDDAIARVIGALKESKMYDDTIVFFSTDNGAPVAKDQGNNYPLRGWKMTPWEGGVRAVAWVRGTNSDLAPLPRGVVSHELMHSSDWLPTVVRGVVGGSTDECQPLDGHDQWKVLAGTGENTRDSVVHIMPDAGTPITSNTTMVVRKGQYKLFVPGTTCPGYPDVVSTVHQWITPEWDSAPTTPTPTPHDHDGLSLFLFNVVADPEEAVNLAASHVDVVDDILAWAQTYQQGAVADLANSHTSDLHNSNPENLPYKAFGPWGCPFV